LGHLVKGDSSIALDLVVIGSNSSGSNQQDESFGVFIHGVYVIDS
jgi:hypothetical protein